MILLFSAGVRIHFREQPFERDEGEYAYAGQLILDGIPPYKLAYNMKFPGTYLAYAALMAVFGETVSGVHVGFILVNSCGIIMVYLLSARLAGRAAGVVAAAIYAQGSLSIQFLGASAHATQFLAPAAIGGLLLLLRGLDGRRLTEFFFSGFLLGIATLMKQHGAFFVIFAGLFLVSQFAPRREWGHLLRTLLVYSAGVALPLAATGLWLWRAGVFHTFWFWTFDYARQYASEFKGTAVLWFDLRLYTPPLFISTLAAGLPGLVIVWRRFPRSTALFISGLLVTALLAIIPGFNFWPHYFILPLPVTALLTAITVVALGEWLHGRAPGIGRIIPYVLLAVIMTFSMVREFQRLLAVAPREIPRLIYGWQHPFAESEPIAAYLKAHTTPAGTIAVLGSEPQIYFYAHRHSATGYLYTYALMEHQVFASQMQREMIQEIESNRPLYLVWVRLEASWMPHADSDLTIFNWLRSYVPSHYDVVGAVEVSERPTEYYWDAEAPAHAASARILVFKRTASQSPRNIDDNTGR